MFGTLLLVVLFTDKTYEFRVYTTLLSQYQKRPVDIDYVHDTTQKQSDLKRQPQTHIQKNYLYIKQLKFDLHKFP